MKHLRLALVASATLVLALGGTVPAQGAPTGISGLAATVTGTSVTLTGNVAFGGEDPLEVGADPVNDNVGGAATAPLGIDVQRMLIAQTDPNNSTLQFTLDLSAMTADGIPEHVAYNWDIAVDGGSSGNGAEYSIKTWRTRAASTLGTGTYAAIFNCVPNPTTGGSSCTAGPTIPVTYDGPNSQIRLSVPLANIGANPGSTITAWNRISAPIWTGGTFGTQTFAGLYDTATHGAYTVPVKQVQVGIAPTGTPISYGTAATLNGSSFSGDLTAPGPGTYDVGVRACFGENCATGMVTITV